MQDNTKEPAQKVRAVNTEITDTEAAANEDQGRAELMMGADRHAD